MPQNGGSPPCLDAADANDEGAVDIGDAVYLSQDLFVNGPVIPGPHPECGVDPTADELSCEEYPGCQ